MYDLDASDYLLVKVAKKMRKGRLNEGFTYSNEAMRESVIVIGPTSSGDEFVNTFVHELEHVATNIASSLGLDLEGEGPAYLAGDSAMELAKILCKLGCSECNE